MIERVGMVMGAAALLVASGAPVGACPSSLGKGLRVAYASGATALIVPGPEAGQVTVRTRAPGDVDEGDVITSWHGVYDTSYVEFGPQADLDPYSVTLTYPDGPPPVPVPGLSKFTVTAMLQEDTGALPEVNSVSSNAMGLVSLGGCSYEGFTLSSTVHFADEPMSEGVTWQFVFVPALGLAIQAGEGEMEVTTLEAVE